VSSNPAEERSVATAINRSRAARGLLGLASNASSARTKLIPNGSETRIPSRNESIGFRLVNERTPGYAHHPTAPRMKKRLPFGRAGVALFAVNACGYFSSMMPTPRASAEALSAKSDATIRPPAFGNRRWICLTT
jgi:hypothetical protein